ncbi:metallophosphoesterase [Phototrophicus methaneseepsis]|uniref:Metallophosphoesterase n=2 Tax=Phototrophicus methaneseepsis TaxID=2710758 RepID=A0A7S8E717_9CHLR|nr:metallophosphoesterase [Phototrophicus methaneseepsis]
MPTLENAANLRRRYSDVDLVVSCGDLPVAYLEYITTILNVPMVYVRGNHDESYEESPPGGINLHQKIFTYEGISFVGLEGSIKYNRGKIQYTQRQMNGMVRGMCLKMRLHKFQTGFYPDILVTHSPPWGIHDADDVPHRGFKGLLTFMQRYKPRYMFHGHVHTWDRRKTVVTDYEETTIMNINPYTIIEIEPRKKQ